jgi:flagellar FliL protein
MTDENQKGMEEKNEGKKKKPLLKWGILAAAALLLICAGIVGAVLFKNNPMEGQSSEKGSPAQFGQPSSIGNLFPLEPFEAKLSAPDGNRILRTRMALEFSRDGFQEELDASLPRVRDAVLLIVNSKTLADIQGMDGKIALRNELIRRINQILTNEKIRNLYFTEFVVR